MNSCYATLEARIGEFISAPTEEFGDLALEVHAFQRAQNTAYRNYCEYLRAPAQPANWQDIPAVPQGVFKQFALRSFPEENTKRTFRTSGTTGEGFGQHHFCSLALYEQAVLCGWDRLQLPHLPQIILTPTATEAPHSSLSQMMAYLGQRAPKQHFCTDLERFEELITDKPVLVLGTALAFLNLFERGKIPKLPAGSMAMETGGYKGSGRDISKTELYSRFQECLGLAPESVLNEYGMTELSSQFYTFGLGRVHTGGPWVRALVIDPETGREVPEGHTGVLLIFDLANLGSVLALQTQDLAIRRGADFELIGRDPEALPRGCSRAADELLRR